MGLDSLDLVFRLEKRLGIKISHAETLAVVFDTPGTIHRYLVAKLRDECGDVPLIEPLVIELSRAVMHVRGRWKFRLPSDLNRCFPPETRAADWQALEQSLGIVLPQLEHRSGEQFATVPPHCDSIISLAYWIAEQHPEHTSRVPVDCRRKGKMSARQWTEDEVWAILCECIAGALSVKPEEITYDARMVEDLGMD